MQIHVETGVKCNQCNGQIDHLIFNFELPEQIKKQVQIHETTQHIQNTKGEHIEPQKPNDPALKNKIYRPVGQYLIGQTYASACIKKCMVMQKIEGHTGKTYLIKPGQGCKFQSTQMVENVYQTLNQ